MLLPNAWTEPENDLQLRQVLCMISNSILFEE
jgi:hypothetical protein